MDLKSALNIVLNNVCVKDKDEDCFGCDICSEEVLEAQKYLKELSKLSKEPIDRGYLSDWYINSISDDEPVWTEEHLNELFADFILIPKNDSIN